MTANSPELRRVWGKDNLLAQDVHLPYGVALERLQNLADERAMVAQIALLSLGRIASEQLGDDAEPLIDAVFGFTMAAANKVLTDRGYSDMEIGAILAIATQPPPEQDPAG